MTNPTQQSREPRTKGVRLNVSGPNAIWVTAVAAMAVHGLSVDAGGSLLTAGVAACLTTAVLARPRSKR